MSCAWRCVADWLLDVAIGVSAAARPHAHARAKRCTWLLLAYSWAHLGDGTHANALRKWVGQISPAMLADRAQLDWLRTTARLVADRTAAYDDRASKAAWKSWISEGPAKSLGRHHRMTRLRTGWIPSAFGREKRAQSHAQGADASGLQEDDDDPDDVDEEELQQAVVLPLSSQAEVDAEAAQWAAEWRADVPPQELPWHGLMEQSPLPAPTVDVARQAAGLLEP